MGFTIEDMLVVSSDRYKMELVAGRDGWSNSISWLLMLEDLTIIQNFSGKELAVTTGLGFQKEDQMLALVEALSAHNASGLIVNTGYYIMELPASVIAYCDENGLPLLTVPWEVYLADMIKDLSVRIFLQSSTDEQISAALIRAIEQPQERDRYAPDLLAHFDLDGSFQIALVTTGDLDRMDTVERRRLSYRMQLYLTNLTHNGHFFYYDSCFVVVMNAIPETESAEILNDFAGRAKRRMADRPLYIGVSDAVTDIENLRTAYRRAKAAVRMAQSRDRSPVFFAGMGIYRILSMVDDHALLRDFTEETLGPVLAHDRTHCSEYLKTLDAWLRCGGSIKAVSEELFIHRNTILYRMSAIRSLLHTSLEDPEERLLFMTACKIYRMEAGIREDP